MNITNIKTHNKPSILYAEYGETFTVERELRRIITYLRIVIGGKALDWQERDRVERIISSLVKTQTALAANLSRYAETIEDIRAGMSA